MAKVIKVRTMTFKAINTMSFCGDKFMKPPLSKLTITNFIDVAFEISASHDLHQASSLLEFTNFAE